MNQSNGNHTAEIKAEFIESIRVKQQVIEQQLSTLNDIANLLVDSLRAGNKALFFGNGGSAADSQHLTAEMVSKFNRVRQAIPAVALTVDTSILTSIGNDFGYDYVFARQIEALGRQGDVAIGISTSGNSPNVLRALQTARDMGLTTVGFTGQSGGQMQGCVDICFNVPSSSTARIQESHITAGHVICEIVEKSLTETADA
ncbi:MAG: D-sedoheptulose 7-phosphate isomerase [Candidatus Promineifilaceae bacterium]|nr:D-sedoheptulose 7-phosphate isomerase [Candidatus Promineifilaceae bacterium]